MVFDVYLKIEIIGLQETTKVIVSPTFMVSCGALAQCPFPLFHSNGVFHLDNGGKGWKGWNPLPPGRRGMRGMDGKGGKGGRTGMAGRDGRKGNGGRGKVIHLLTKTKYIININYLFIYSAFYIILIVEEKNMYIQYQYLKHSSFDFKSLRTCPYICYIVM